jgi:hypothetical protein
MVNKELGELHYQKILEPTFALAEKYFMGDKALEAQWDELSDFLTTLILDGLGSDQS